MNYNFNVAVTNSFWYIISSFTAGLAVKNLSVQETLVQSLVQEDSLEKEMATHPNISAWEIPWTE